MIVRRLVGIGLLGACAVACGADTNSGSNEVYAPPGQGTVPEQTAPEQTTPEQTTPEQTVPEVPDPAPQVSPSLAPLLPQGATLVGLTITPAGEYYVLDIHSGLYHLSNPGQPGATAELVFDTRDLDSRYMVSAGLQFTDVASMEENRFLITAANDGYLLDLQQDRFESYFCYLPAIVEESSEPVEYMSISQTMQAEGIAVEQRTESVAYNPVTQALFAQPRTVRLDTQQVAGSELFMFDYTGGQPVRVVGLEQNFLAGGMLTDGDTVLLGRGNQLYRSTLDQGYSLITTFDANVSIVGMARDLGGNVVLLDGTAGTLITLNMSQ